IFLRRWLGAAAGEQPSDVQAACWLDVKRVYLTMRPALRRVYLCVADLAPYAASATELGFRLLPDASPALDGSPMHSAVLDFGPRSVDGWLARLAAAELGIGAEPSVLDMASRELVIEGARLPLTPLEFGLLRHLIVHEGRAVPRDELLRDVWGNRSRFNSNVVDAVVLTLRRKLAHHASCVQTVTGVGYRYRPPTLG